MRKYKLDGIFLLPLQQRGKDNCNETKVPSRDIETKGPKGPKQRPQHRHWNEKYYTRFILESSYIRLIAKS